MANFQNFLSWLLDSIVAFLSSEPITYIVWIFIALMIIKLFKSIISQ